MPTIDLTITISVILALAAIISPVMTTIINNCHQTKLKKLEAKQKENEITFLHKREILENYLKFLSGCSFSSSSESAMGYASYYPLALAYLPEHIRVLMIETNELINSCRPKHVNVHKEVDEITLAISEYMQSM